MIYKVIKWLVPVFMVLVLYKRFLINPNLSFQKLKETLMNLDWYWMPFVFIMSIVNWGIETRKWQYLICKLEIQSFKVAMKSVLCGVTVAQMLPYRTGEYFGRLAYVKDEHKIQAGVLSVIGSFSQLLVTLLFGVIALAWVQPGGIDPFVLFLLPVGLILVLLGYFHLPRAKFLFNWTLFNSIHQALQLLKPSDVRRLLGFSFLRYFSFLIPYAVLLIHFDLDKEGGILMASLLVACIFFFQTVSPSFILTDVSIRLLVPVFVLTGTTFKDPVNEFLPGMIIYIFNIILPMLAGAFILITLKLKK